MAADTPHDWLRRVASTDPGRALLVGDGRVLTYAETLDKVETRADVIASGVGTDEIVCTEVAVDLDSIIELLAIQVAGGVPLPYIGRPPELPVATVPFGAVCVSTSGSSGVSKVVPLTYENIAASASASRSRLGNDADDRWLLCLPLNHVGGLSVVWRSLEAGGAVIVAPFDVVGGLIETHQPTIASFVPTMVHRLLDENPRAIASIGTILVGGASTGTELWHRSREFGVRLVPTYGTTETSSQVATLASDDDRIARGLVGKPLDGFAVSIVGRDGLAEVDGVVGRIVVEGDAVFSGYLGESFRSGPWTTDDIGWLTEDGDLFIEGRYDDVVISGGENVSLGWVQNSILGFAGVSDVCVVVLEDERWGMVVCAMVVAESPLDSADPMVRAGLEPHERPKRWLMRNEIPTIVNGKHDVVAVRAAFEEELWT